MHYPRSERRKGLRLVRKADRQVRPVLDLTRYRRPLGRLRPSLARDRIVVGVP